MRKLLSIGLCVYACVATLFLLHQEPVVHADDPGTPVGNGDVNGDGGIDISDAIHLLNFLFMGGSAVVPIECGPGPSAMDPLGRGYDIFGTYANRTEVKEPILDAGGLAQAGRIETIPLESSDYKSIAGTSIDTYSSSLMESCNLSGSYQGFSGSIRQSFNKERYESDQYSFATWNIYVQKSASIISDRLDVASLKPYLTAAFVQRIDDPGYSPELLFATYGTHCMTGVINGARLDYNVSARTTDLKEGKSLSLYAELSYKSALMGASIDAGVAAAMEYSKYQTSESKVLKAYGGSSELAVNIATKADFDSWLLSIPGNAVFCGYYSNALIPIWEFCADQGRKDAISEAFSQWGATRRIDVVRTPRKTIIGLDVALSWRGDSYIKDGLTYYPIAQDLNAGAGGNFIYIYAAVGFDDDPAHPPITSLVVWNHEDAKLADQDTAYTLISGDMNRGAGGDTIELLYTTDRSKGGPIRAIRTKDGGSFKYSLDASASQGYVEAYNTIGNIQDLNEGSGGHTITLQFSRDYID